MLERLTRGRGLRELLRRSVQVNVERFRRRGRGAVAWTTRLTAAAVASFVVADLVFPGTVPLLAPLTALLVIQITPVSILRSGVERVISVVLGVTVAIGFTSWVGLTWWSLGTVIAFSLALGQALRLGGNTLEVAISAMLVLGVGAATAESAAWKRIAETLVGAGVGVLANLVYPPRVTSKDAATTIEGLGIDLALLLAAAAEDLRDDNRSVDDLAGRCRDWLGQARRITHDMPNVGSALVRAEQSRRLNLRALVRSDSGPSLRHGLEALEHSSVVVRSMMRSFVEAVQAYQAAGQDIPPNVRAAARLLLVKLAAALRSYGALVRAQAEPATPERQLGDHRVALTDLRDARAEVTEGLLVNPHDEPILAAFALSLLSSVDRVVQELDLDEERLGRAHPRTTPPVVKNLRRPSGR